VGSCKYDKKNFGFRKLRNSWTILRNC